MKSTLQRTYWWLLLSVGKGRKRSMRREDGREKAGARQSKMTNVYNTVKE